MPTSFFSLKQDDCSPWLRYKAVAIDFAVFLVHGVWYVWLTWLLLVTLVVADTKAHTAGTAHSSSLFEFAEVPVTLDGCDRTSDVVFQM